MGQTLESKMLLQFAKDIEKGLSANKKNINPKYFYDDSGSKLFEQICLQPEYYPTKIEHKLLKDNIDQIFDLYNNNEISLIELGSGNSEKTKIILTKFTNNKTHNTYYFPIDVSKDALIKSSYDLDQEFPRLHHHYIVSEYIDGLVQVKKHIDIDNNIPKKGIILFLGSSFGNLEPDYAIDFLKNIKKNITSIDLLLIGVDLHKNKQILQNAYNDKAGITAKFNLNILTRINRDLLGKFDLDTFEHFAFYNEEKRRIEMHLKSKQDQNIRIGYLDKIFHFAKNETIHTENSYKYSISDIKELFYKCGFTVDMMFTDEKKWFSLSLLRHIKY